jgi:diketogulonate reductase-like aldo/keto reductase
MERSFSMNTAGQSWIVLNNGVKMPQFGLGVWQTENGQQVIDAVKAAVKAGYRAIDTAAAYENEDGVGQGIRECGLDRNELFITSKLWNSDQGYDNTLRAFDKTMERLGLDVLDLYLIHWPCPNDGLFVETWKAFETLYKQGRVRAIGLSNFTKENIQTLLDSCEIKPMVNQIECHPYLTQVEMQSFLFQNQIAMTAWSPLAHGEVFGDQTLQKIADKYGKNIAQVVIRWELQRGIITIPKSINPKRIEENIQVFDFVLSAEDMIEIDMLNKNHRTGPDPLTFHKK